MSLDLDRMRYLTRKGLGGLSSTQLDNTDCDELLNLSLWALEDKFPFETKEQCFTASLVVGETEYSLSMPRLDAIHSIAVIDDEGNKHKLARMTQDWIDENFVDDEEGTPTRYLRKADILVLYPTPDEVLTMEINIRQSVESLLEGSVEVTGLPRNWDEIVVHGAIWRGHYFNEDYNLAQQAANFQIGLIRDAVPTKAKEERDSRYAGLQVLHDWPVGMYEK